MRIASFPSVTSSISFLLMLTAFGVGGCAKQTPTPPASAVTPPTTASPDQIKAFLDTLRGMTPEARRTYIQQHQELAMQTWHNPDPNISDEYTKLMTQTN